MLRKKTTHVIIHHSWTEDNKLLKDTEAIKRYHMQKRGWRDIGYHLVLELVNGAYTWCEGRPIDEVGAHCLEEGRNRDSIGICVVGNFDELYPPSEVYVMLAEKIDELNQKYRTQLIVEPHNKYAPKTCPGKLFDMEILKAYIYNYYIDVSKSDYGYNAISNVTNLGIMNGVGFNAFNPDGYITRRDLAIVIDRLIDYIEQ